MADSGTYEPSTVARRQKIAEAMLMNGRRPVTHWAEGLANIADAGVGGLLWRKAETDEKAGQSAARDAIAGLLGGGSSPQAAPVAFPSAGAGVPAASAIASIESGGKYDALGPVIPKTGDRAYGKYQVMGANVGPWTEQHFGQRLTPEQFLTNQAAQDAVFKGQFGGYEKKYGPEGAARAWFAGEGGMNNPNAKDVLGTSVADYSRKFVNAGGAAPVAAAMSPQGGDPAALPPNAQPTQGFAVPGQQAQQPTDPKARIAALLNSKNPYVQKVGMQLAQGYIQKNILGGEQTNDIKELERSNADRRAAGLPPFRLDEYQVHLKEAGKPVTNINQQQESEFQKGAGKFYSDRYGEMVKGASDAKELITDIGSLRDLGSRVNTGKTAEVMAALGPYAEALGVKIDGLGEMQAYNAIVAKLAPRMRVAGSGATSDFEMQNFLKALPGLGKTPQGNEIIANTLEAVQQHKLAAGEIANRALSGEITRQEAEKQIKGLGDPLAMWKKNKGALPTSPASNTGSSPSAQPQPARVRKTINGKSYYQENGQWFEE